MATRKYMKNQIKHIPKHKRAKMRKNRKGFRRQEFDMAWYKLIREGYDLQSKYLYPR